MWNSVDHSPGICHRSNRLSLYRSSRGSIPPDQLLSSQAPAAGVGFPADVPQPLEGAQMGLPSASHSITMRVHLGADPLGIGRITTAVGEAAGTVVAVDIVESHHDLLVVDLTCNAADARHAEAITGAVGAIEGARVHAVSDRNLSLLHATAPSLDEAVLAQRTASGIGRKEGRRESRPPSDSCAAPMSRQRRLKSMGRLEHCADRNSPPRWCCRALPHQPRALPGRLRSWAPRRDAQAACRTPVRPTALLRRDLPIAVPWSVAAGTTCWVWIGHRSSLGPVAAAAGWPGQVTSRRTVRRVPATANAMP
jgi:hypothetical protein